MALGCYISMYIRTISGRFNGDGEEPMISYLAYSLIERIILCVWW